MQKYIHVKRLIYSCENWKERSLKYQSEKRDISFKLRDTKISRDYWKAEYYEISKQLSALKKKYQKMKELAQQILED
jgi:hypothetical protein